MSFLKNKKQKLLNMVMFFWLCSTSIHAPRSTPGSRGRVGSPAPMKLREFPPKLPDFEPQGVGKRNSSGLGCPPPHCCELLGCHGRAFGHRPKLLILDMGGSFSRISESGGFPLGLKKRAPANPWSWHFIHHKARAIVCGLEVKRQSFDGW